MSEWFEQMAGKMTDQTAITILEKGELETRISYKALADDIARFSCYLMKNGVEKGARVIVLLDKSLIAVVAHFAILKAGAVVVPLNPGFKTKELEYLFNDADPSLIITSPSKKEMVDSIRPGIDILEINTAQLYQDLAFFKSEQETVHRVRITRNDPGLIIYTSGTTGNPKGAVLTHGNLIADTKNIIQTWEITEKDHLCHALPLFHVHGLCFALHTALLAGSRVLMLKAFIPETVVDVLASKNARDSCTLFMGVPAMYSRLMDYIESKDMDFDHLRLLTSGSAPLLEKDFYRIEKIFGKIPVEREGMSETGMNFSNPLSGMRKPGSIGLPMPGVQARIVDPESHNDVDAEDVGEIWLKSPAITHGYWHKPNETKESFHQGWFKTGDLGKADEDGYYFLTDRIKHIIITGGENVSAKEVETVINTMDDVIESAAVGIPDDKWGEKVVAMVATAQDAGLNESFVITCCKESLHDWKCPKRVVFTDQLPKNTMGKVLKETVKKLIIDELKNS